MWVVVLVIALSIAMVIGPIMLLQPSTGTNRLAKIRTLASQNGMRLRMAPGVAGMRRGAYYSVPLPPALEKAKLPSWHLVKNAMHHDIHFSGFWDWEGEGRPNAMMTDYLCSVLDDLPEGISAIQCASGTLSVCWDEGLRGAQEEAAVKTVKALLDSLLAGLASCLKPMAL